MGVTRWSLRVVVGMVVMPTWGRMEEEAAPHQVVLVVSTLPGTVCRHAIFTRSTKHRQPHKNSVTRQQQQQSRHSDWHPVVRRWPTLVRRRVEVAPVTAVAVVAVSVGESAAAVVVAAVDASWLSSRCVVGGVMWAAVTGVMSMLCAGMVWYGMTWWLVVLVP